MINNILEDDWTPSEGGHEETIYYIAGYVLRVVHRKDNDNREVYSNVYRLLESNTSTSKERSSMAALSLGCIERAEAMDLF